jgi:hypothetical protein
MQQPKPKMGLDSCPEFQKPFKLGLGLKAEVGFGVKDRSGLRG